MNKNELARMYFPHSTPRAALCRLMRWINRCAPLMEALRRTGYKDRNRSLTYRQVLLVKEYLGEPDAEDESNYFPS